MFLSKESYLTSHFEHQELDGVPYGPEYCTICVACDDEDDGIATAAATVRNNEHEASITIARRLKKLVSVGWSSFFPVGGSKHLYRLEDMEDRDAERAMTVFIWRGDGRIKARNRPW
jgi:hypothetical protein